MDPMRMLRHTAAGLTLLLTPLAGWAQAPAQTPADSSQPDAGLQAAPALPPDAAQPAKAAPGSAPLPGQAMPPSPPPDVLPDSDTVVRLTDVEGSVRLTDGAGKLFTQVLPNMAVLPGSTLETANDGRAELEFADGSVARVTPNSALTLAAQISPDRTRLILKPTRGLTYYEFAPGAGSFLVEVGQLTAYAAADSAGQVLLRVNLDTKPYQAAVLRGVVHFEDASGNATYDLPANETARIDPGAATDYDIAQEVQPDSWDAWNNDRDSARAQIASAAPAGSAGGESAGPGWNDLNYYGSWYDVPGEGAEWVGENFDPYGSGAWGLYDQTGYEWISSYPWGWLPYHCGLWNYNPGFGWLWRPGGACGWGTRMGWYPYSGIGSGPSGYRLPTRPVLPIGIKHHVPAQPLIAINRGAGVQFRQVGEARPVTRTLVVSGMPVQPLPVEARPSYQAVVSGYRSTVAPSGFVTSGRGLAFVAPRVQVTPRAYVPAPAPRMSAPPAMMSAPHGSAPSGGGGHGH